MESLNVVFHVSLNKLLNKPAYDVTVMDDFTSGDASLLSAQYIKSVYVFTITVDAMYSQYFQSATNWKLDVWIHSKHVSIRTGVLGLLPYMVALRT